MRGFTEEELGAARKAIGSTIHKSEKARETLLGKEPPRLGQVKMVERNLAALYAAAALVAGEPVGCDGEALEEIRRTLEGMIRQVGKVLPKFQPGTPQHTLAARRIRAFEIALARMEEGSGAIKF